MSDAQCPECRSVLHVERLRLPVRDCARPLYCARCDLVFRDPDDPQEAA